MRATLRRNSVVPGSIFAIATLVAAGCGGPGARDSEAGDVRAAVATYFRAIDNGDGAAMCSHLTDQTQRAIAKLQRASCKSAMVDEARRLPEALNAYDVTDVSVDGGRATVALRGRGTGLEERMKLRRHRGSWKISDAPGLGQ